MRGFWDGLSPEQKVDALAYRGDENHGDEKFKWRPPVPLKFKTAADRDAFAKRLDSHAYYMIRSRDQGMDGRIVVTDELIDDLRAAAAIVACCDIT
jgi:hypothetical protein